MTQTQWVRYRVTAHTLEPVVMTSGDHSRNRASTLPFITGSALRGALAARWLRAHDLYPAPGQQPEPIKDSDRRKRFLTVFESGAVRFPFLFGVPPTPLSLIGCKRDRRHHLIDLADPAQRPDQHDDRGGDGEQDRKVCPVPGCGAPLERVKPEEGEGPAKAVRTRTAISDQGTAARAMLYAQEELAEGQKFTGTMRVRPDLADELAEWLPVDPGGKAATDKVTVGADRSTGGLVELTFEKRPRSSDSVKDRLTAWREACSVHGPGELVLTARSPLLLTDAWLRPARRFDPAVLERLLPGVQPVEVTYDAARTRAVAGWNPAAGLPKPTDTALVEGSVAALQIPDGTDWEALTARLVRLEDEGVGWRRAEGFGEVMCWDPRHLETREGGG